MVYDARELLVPQPIVDARINIARRSAIAHEREKIQDARSRIEAIRKRKLEESAEETEGIKKKHVSVRAPTPEEIEPPLSMNVARRSRANLEHPDWSHRITMQRHCFHCGGNHYAENCKIDEPYCIYPLCNSTRHTIAACTVLQGRCFSCHCRGHRKSDCLQMPRSTLKNQYYCYASLGVYSRAMLSGNRNWLFEHPGMDR